MQGVFGGCGSKSLEGRRLTWCRFQVFEGTGKGGDWDEGKSDGIGRTFLGIPGAEVMVAGCLKSVCLVRRRRRAADSFTFYFCNLQFSCKKI
jgi:hypothetical protein